MHLEYLTPVQVSSKDGNLGASAIHIGPLQQELDRMLDMAQDNIETSFDAVLSRDSSLLTKAEKMESYLDFLNKEISKYISRLITYETNEQGSSIVSSYFTITGNIERIGDHAMIQGGALLGQDAPPFVIVRNDTMRFAGINKIGLSRRGFTPERIGEIHDACRILFQSGLNYMSGCEEVEKQVPQSKERDELVKFIRESKRGIIKPYESVSKEE